MDLFNFDLVVSLVCEPRLNKCSKPREEELDQIVKKFRESRKNSF